VSMPMGLYSACLRTNSPLFRGDHGPSDEILLISRLLAASSDRTLFYIETIWSTERTKVMASSGSTNATSSITMFINLINLRSPLLFRFLHTSLTTTTIKDF
jgi:hypothetical protein